MKKPIYQAILATIVASFTANLCFAQFNIGGMGPGDRWGQTNDPGGTINDVRRIGIGHFNNFNSAPAAAFHINANFMTAVDIGFPNFFLPGEVFRTSGPTANINAWRMFTGAGNGTEKFNVHVPAGSSDVYIVTYQNGFLAFGTNATERLRITAAGDVHIKNLACNDCLVMANQQGQLYTDNHTIKNLEEKIKQLEEKLLIMEKLMTKNE